MQGRMSSRFNRLIVVSYRLPFRTVVYEGQRVLEQNSGGLVSAILAYLDAAHTSSYDDRFKKLLWIGCSETDPSDDAAPPRGLTAVYDDIARRVKKIVGALGFGTSHQEPSGQDAGEIQQSAVVLDKKTIEAYYGGFCNDCIWPLFHYFTSLVAYDDGYYESYCTANRLFAEKIAAIAEPGDFIWVHDYQLMMLPGMLRERMPDAQIAFFLHIPFPAFDVFRTLPRRWREEILRGVLGADLVGFHTFDYSQHFLRSVSRLLGNEITMNAVVTDDRVVRVDAFPLGIDYEKFNRAATESPEVAEKKRAITEMLGGTKLIFSVDRLDYTKGLLQRLEAYEYFLKVFPEWIGKIVFNMVVIPSRDTIPHYQNMKREIEAAVGRINGAFSTMAWRPILYQYKSLSFPELVALYDTSHVGLITPLRDGMNLVAKEYIACQGKEKGVLILSEMAGAAAELSEAMLINPADKREVADALNAALSLPLRNRAVLVARMQKRLKRYTVFTWVREIVDAMETVKREQEVRRIKVITPALKQEIAARFVAANRRVVFLDYDGTLVPFSRVPELAIPSASTMQVLRTLSSFPATDVVIISGRDASFLEEWFSAASVHLIAEHGACRKSPGGDWIRMVDDDERWKAQMIPIFQRYADHCNGSFVEEKRSSLAWHYRNAPPEIGVAKAKELSEELRALVAHENRLQVIDGNKVVEIKRSGYDKGVAARNFLGGGEYDCILALGDDRTDEDIFRSLPREAITIKVGMTTSLARYNLRNQDEVLRFLSALCGGKPVS